MPLLNNVFGVFRRDLITPLNQRDLHVTWSVTQRQPDIESVGHDGLADEERMSEVIIRGSRGDR
jgi:hypothetical protein